MVDHDILGQALESLRTPLAIYDRQGRCLFSNQSFRHFLQLKDEVTELPELSLVCPTLEREGGHQGEMTLELCLPSGATVASRVALRVFGDGNVLMRLVAGAAHYEALDSFHSQRLETLGLLAGGIAHDFNNVLAGILGHISYLKTILPGAGPHVESLRTIEDGSKKASQMTQQILKFSKMEPADVSPVDLNDLVQRTVSLLRRAISPEFNIVMHPCEERVTVLAAEAKLAQILANLMINARDALTQNGTISVALRRVTNLAELDEAFQSHERGASGYVKLVVEDDGHGIPNEVRERIFEPYFSTKSDKGTGLGLTTVLSIVRELGGAITVDSEAGRGTRISVYVPCIETPPADESLGQTIDSRTPLVPRGVECVLVIDDEYPVRNVIALGLTHLGYRVLSASSGIEGIELYRAQAGQISLVLLDMLMPKLSGHEVFFKLRSIDPDACVLLMSGYSSEELVEDVLRNGGKGFLQKPFSIEELSRKVRGCLDARVKGQAHDT